MASKLALQAAVEVGTTTPPESETELANAPTPDTASGAINGDSKMGAGSKTQATSSSPSSDLLRKLQLQVEFYFSPQNLKNDPYLVSQMNGEKYVPIRLITSFPKIAAMTTEQSVVAQAVSKSLVCSVDASGTMIKPISTAMPTVERNTIILRDLKNSTEEDIQQLFQSNETCGTIVSLRSDIGDTWFVTMESEEIAKDSLLALRMGKGFNGVKIKGSLKTVSMYSAAAAASGRSSFGSNAIDAPAFVPSFMPASNGGASKEAAPKFDSKKQQPKSLMGTGRQQMNNPMGGSATAEQQTAALAQYYGISVPEIKQVMNGMNPFMYTQMMNSNYYMSLMAQQNGNGGNNGGYGNRGNYSNNKNFRNSRNNGNRSNKDYNNNRNNNGNYINQPPLSNSKGRQQSQPYYTPLNGTGHVQQLQPHPNHNNNHNNNNHHNNNHHNSHHNNSHHNHANKTMLVQPITKKKKKQVDPNMAVPSQMSGGGTLKHKKRQKDDGTTGNSGGTGNGSGIKELSPATHSNVKELVASNPRSGVGRVPRGDHKELKPSSTSTSSTAVANKKKNKNNKNAASTSTNQSGNATFVPPASAPNFTSTAAFPTLGGPGNNKNNAAPSPWSASTSAVKKKPTSSKLHKKVTAPTNSMNSTDSTMDHKSTAKKEDPSATLSSNNTTPTRSRSKKDPSSPSSDMETTAVSTSNAPFSWAATVKKTANVPVQEKVKPAPVSKKSDKSKKNKRNRKKDASPSSSSSYSSSTATKEAVSDIVNSMVNTVGDAGSSSSSADTSGTSGSTTPPTVTMPSKTAQQLTPTRRSGKTSWADAADEDSDESDDESDDLSPNRRGGGSLRSALSATYGEDASKTVGTTAGSNAGNAQPATRRGWEPVGVTKSRQIAKPSSSSTTTTPDTTKVEKTGGWANIVKKQASPSSGEATANLPLNSRAQAFK